jgi:predicted anti-sigma-YlaC factor YlaD
MFRDKRRNRSVTTHRRRRSTRPANVIAAVVGIFSIVLGVWALIRTGLNTDHIFTPSKDVLGLPHTPTLALGEIAFGVLLLLAAMSGAFGTFVIALLGAASFAFGVIVVSDSWSGRVHRWTAASHDTGWIFILIGAVFVLAAVLPALVSTRRAPAEQPPVAVEPEAAEPEAAEPEAAEPEAAEVDRPTAGESSVPEDADATASSESGDAYVAHEHPAT